MFYVLRSLLALLLLTLTSGAQIPNECQQLMLVIAPDWDSTPAVLQRYQREEQGWAALGKAIPVVLGRKGLAWGRGKFPMPAQGKRKREGDGRSPAGIFSLGPMWLRESIPGPKKEYPHFPITGRTQGVDDVRSVYYNQVVENVPRDWNSAEEMDISDYDRVLQIEHNGSRPTLGQPDKSPKAIAGAGSCIFMHRWASPTHGTAGCTAMSEENLIEVFDWLDAKQWPHIVQLTEKEAQNWRKAGRIP